MLKTLFLLSIFGLVSACGEKKEENETSAAAPAEEKPREQTPAETADLNAIGLTSGLPSFCKALDLDNGKTCYRCDIKNTPIDRCIAVEDFDLAENCSHDQTKLQCKIDAKQTHLLSLDGPIELQILNFVPFAVITAKTFVGLKFNKDNQQNIKTVILNSLDFVATNIRKFVLVEDRVQLQADVLSFARTQHGIMNKTANGDPEELPEATVKDVENGTEAVLDFFQEKRLTGQLNLLDSIELAKQIAKAVPSLGIEEHLAVLDFASLDITAILSEILKSASSSETNSGG